MTGWYSFIKIGDCRIRQMAVASPFSRIQHWYGVVLERRDRPSRCCGRPALSNRDEGSPQRRLATRRRRRDVQNRNRRRADRLGARVRRPGVGVRVRGHRGELVAYVATWRETEERVCLARAGRHFLDVNASEPGVGVLALLSADDGQGRIVAEAEPRGLESPPRSVRSESVNLEAGEPCYRLSVLSGVVAVTATARLVRE